MSTGGKISIKARRRRQCQKILKNVVIRENQELCDCFQDINVLIESPHEIIQTQIVALQQTGKNHLDISNINPLANEYKFICEDIKRECQSDSLVASINPQVIVSNRMIQIARNTLDNVKKSTTEFPLIIEAMEKEIAVEVVANREAYESALLVAGKYCEPNTPIIKKYKDLLQIKENIKSHPDYKWIIEQSEEIKVEIEKKTSNAWVAVVQTAVQLAAIDAGFPKDKISMNKEEFTAIDPDNSSNKLIVKVDYKEGSMEYDFTGYKEGECKKRSTTFLKKVCEYLGAELSAQNHACWSKECQDIKSSAGGNKFTLENKKKKVSPGERRVRN